MSVSQASNPIKEMASVCVYPLLSDEMRMAFVNLLYKYCVELSKSQDKQDFHLATVHLSAAIDVCLCICLLDFGTDPFYFQIWCTKNYCSFRDLKFNLVDYNKLDNTVNTDWEVFRCIGYQNLFIQNELWEDSEHKPKIVHHFIVGIKTCEMLAHLQSQKIIYRMVEAPHSLI